MPTKHAIEPSAYAKEVPQPRSRSRQRWWGRLAMSLFPPAVRLLGYTFRTGHGPAFSSDARAVLEAVWSAPAEYAGPHRQYVESPTWMIGYRHGKPIACMALYDVRELSFSLNHLQAAPLRGVDPASYRDLSRLAIVPAARGGSQLVMIGLLREMALWCWAQGVTQILSISVPSLFPVFERYNPSAKQVTLEPASTPVPEVIQSYHDRIAARVGPVISYTFDLDGFDALSVMLRAFTRPFRRVLRRLGLRPQASGRSSAR